MERSSIWRFSTFKRWICSNFRKCRLSLGNLLVGRSTHKSIIWYRFGSTKYMVWIWIRMVEWTFNHWRLINSSRKLERISIWKKSLRKNWIMEIIRRSWIKSRNVKWKLVSKKHLKQYLSIGIFLKIKSKLIF